MRSIASAQTAYAVKRHAYDSAIAKCEVLAVCADGRTSSQPQVFTHAIAIRLLSIRMRCDDRKTVRYGGKLKRREAKLNRKSHRSEVAKRTCHRP